MAWAVQEKHPQGRQFDQWKEAIRWFFRTADQQEHRAPQKVRKGQNPTAWRGGWPEWKVAFLRNAVNAVPKIPDAAAHP